MFTSFGARTEQDYAVRNIYVVIVYPHACVDVRVSALALVCNLSLIR